MEKTKRDFNGVAKFLLGLSMFATTMTIINSFLQISNMKMFGYVASDTLAIEIVLDFLILGAAVLTFLKKPAGLIALTALFIIRMFATIPWDGDTSAAYMLGGKMVYFIRDFGLFAIAMCFKKNGISGWRSMLASEEYVVEHTRGSEVENSAPNENEQKLTLSEDISEQDKVGDSTDHFPELNQHGSMVAQTKPYKELVEEEEPENVPQGTLINNDPAKKKPNKRLSHVVTISSLALIAFGSILLYLHNDKGQGGKRTNYLYMEKSGDERECVIHRDPKCKGGLVFIELENVYSGGFNESNFCSKCISPKQLRPILDSCNVYRERKEVSEHISKFYKAFNEKYNDFDTEQDFRNWLNSADSSKIRKLFTVFSRKYDNFDGPFGLDEMIKYLGWKNPQRVNSSTPSEETVFHMVEVHEDDKIISEADLARNRNNLAKVYSILKEEGYTDLGKNLDGFASMMSQVVNRKLAHELLSKNYEMDSFEEFDERFYPATEEHLTKEKDRRWLYRKLKEKGVAVGDYDTFCLLLCYDEDLRNYYNRGREVGLNLGSYEEYRKAIR